MPSRTIMRQRVAALVAAAGLAIAITGEVLNIHQIVAVAYIGLTAGVVALIIESFRSAATEKEAIEAQAFATALDIILSGELDRTGAPTNRHGNS